MSSSPLVLGAPGQDACKVDASEIGYLPTLAVHTDLGTADTIVVGTAQADFAERANKACIPVYEERQFIGHASENACMEHAEWLMSLPDGLRQVMRSLFSERAMYALEGIASELHYNLQDVLQQSLIDYRLLEAFEQLSFLSEIRRNQYADQVFRNMIADELNLVTGQDLNIVSFALDKAQSIQKLFERVLVHAGNLPFADSLSMLQNISNITAEFDWFEAAFGLPADKQRFFAAGVRKAVGIGKQDLLLPLEKDLNMLNTCLYDVRSSLVDNIIGPFHRWKRGVNRYLAHPSTENKFNLLESVFAFSQEIMALYLKIAVALNQFFLLIDPDSMHDLPLPKVPNTTGLIKHLQGLEERLVTQYYCNK